jgi:hypothetical protein
MILNRRFVGLHSKFERRIFLGKRKTAFYRNISGTEEVVYKNGIDPQSSVIRDVYVIAIQVAISSYEVI